MTARLKKQDVRGRLLTLTLRVTGEGHLMINIGVTAKQTGRGEAKSIVTADAVLTLADAADLATVLAEHADAQIFLSARAATPALPFDADPDPATLISQTALITRSDT
jgi:hypothetical protein